MPMHLLQFHKIHKKFFHKYKNHYPNRKVVCQLYEKKQAQESHAPLPYAGSNLSGFEGLKVTTLFSALIKGSPSEYSN